jgi:hypothetical protein
MFKKILFLFLLFQAQIIFSQEHSINAVQISVDKTVMDLFLGYDGMGNIYYAINNVLFKKNNQELWQYKNISLGKITRIDFQNQLKIILFYENFNSIIILDNQLNEIQKINFSENETPIVATAASVASLNSIWIYNSLTQQIGLFDYLKGTFKAITPALNGGLKYYQSDFNNFYWIDESLNWYTVNIFGKVQSNGLVPEFDQIQFISNQEFIFSKNKKIALQLTSTKSSHTIGNLKKSFDYFYYKDQILSIFTNQEITNYKINKP